MLSVLLPEAPFEHRECILPYQSDGMPVRNLRPRTAGCVSAHEEVRDRCQQPRGRGHNPPINPVELEPKNQRLQARQTARPLRTRSQDHLSASAPEHLRAAVGNDGATNFLGMDFLEGESFAERLKKGPFPAEELLASSAEFLGANSRELYGSLAARARPCAPDSV